MDQSLASVMRNINDALRLDNDCHDKEAYMKYLDCVLCIICNLQEGVRNAGGNVIITKQVSKQVRLAQQCIERVAVLVEKIGFSPKTVVLKSPEEMVVPAKPEPFVAVPPLSPEPTANTFSRTIKKTPMELAYKQNHQLMTAYRARMKRMNKGDPGAFNLSLTIQRKMEENLAIAKRTEMALAKKMQERQERLEEQAAKRFGAPIGMSEEEQEQRMIYKKILEYEQDAKWLQDWRGKLDANPQEPELICQLIQEIMRCQDHPLTLLLKQYQHKIYEKIYPLVSRKEKKLDAVVVPLDKSLWPEDLCDVQNGVDKGSQFAVCVEGKERNAEGEGLEKEQDVHYEQKTDSLFSSACEEATSKDTCSGHTKRPSSSCTEKTETEERTSVVDIFDSSHSHLQMKQSHVQEISLEDSNFKEDPNKSVSYSETLNTNENNLAHKPFQKDGLSSDVDCERTAAKNCSADNLDSEGTEESQKSRDQQSLLDIHATEDCSHKNSGAPTISSEETADLEAPISFAENTKETLSQAIIKGDHLQAQLKVEQERAARILRHISHDYERYNAENMDDLFDDDDEEEQREENSTLKVPPEDRESDQSAAVFSQASCDGPASLVSTSSSLDFESLPQDPQSGPFGNDRKEELERMSKESYQRHLKHISADVHGYLEKLLILFTIAYEQLDSPLGRDQCYASLEESFFKRLWKYLLKLFRLANYKEEVVVACKMTQKAGAGPRDMGVTQKLCLVPATTTDSGTVTPPYHKAITQLSYVKDHYTMLSKLECLVKVVHLVFDSIKDFYISEGCKATDIPSVGADDLLPVMGYIVMQSRLPQLVSECQAMSEFVHEGYIMGQEGYCLTTLETAVSFIVSSNLNEAISPT